MESSHAYNLQSEGFNKDVILNLVEFLKLSEEWIKCLSEELRHRQGIIISVVYLIYFAN